MNTDYTALLTALAYSEPMQACKVFQYSHYLRNNRGEVVGATTKSRIRTSKRNPKHLPFKVSEGIPELQNLKYYRYDDCDVDEENEDSHIKLGLLFTDNRLLIVTVKRTDDQISRELQVDAQFDDVVNFTFISGCLLILDIQGRLRTNHYYKHPVHDLDHGSGTVTELIDVNGVKNMILARINDHGCVRYSIIFRVFGTDFRTELLRISDLNSKILNCGKFMNKIFIVSETMTYQAEQTEFMPHRWCSNGGANPYVTPASDIDTSCFRPDGKVTVEGSELTVNKILSSEIVLTNRGLYYKWNKININNTPKPGRNDQPIDGTFVGAKRADNFGFLMSDGTFHVNDYNIIHQIPGKFQSL